MTTEQAIRIVYTEIYGTTLRRDNIGFYVQKNGCYDPLADCTEDTEAGLAEFARVLLWGTEQGFVLTTGAGWCYVYDIKTGQETDRISGIVQIATLHAIAAAIVARREGTA